MTRRSIRKRRHLPKPRFIMTLGGEEVMAGTVEVREQTSARNVARTFRGGVDFEIPLRRPTGNP